ncbi:T9SS type A sorting domain-containing protein [Tunicatimonas pelagia]|uniref:golvesin C-terminal-like domain-containing protein n=1 Tax=Tunicatimonas pelagia TaxID=931531 RepID=UPI0026666FAC|nr:T9SS type A sorting domain-containing protein [Tunicatimonas pelagia]WKN45470.1 T9SS type A sorting domain-containing protein [Tunicatimonas pelagia]
MNQPVKLFSLTLLFLAGVCPAWSQEDAQWSNVPIGGGGRTVGFIGSPTSDMIYLRTDVAGMYKKRASDTEWTRLTENFGPEYGERMEGCAGLGVHPTDDNILYSALSKGIYKSTNQGDTWDQVLNLRIFPNGGKVDRSDRNYGEALVVDPFNGEVVYYGSQDQGLFYTRNGGRDWNTISTDQLPANGSRSIVVDNTREQIDAGTENARAKFVYVSVRNEGLYRSTDGGNSFSQWQDTLPGGGTYIRWLRISQNGDLYAAHEKGLARWDGQDWLDVSPVDTTEVTTVATDPRDDTRLICFTDGNMHRSQDRGETWEIIPYQVGDIAQWSSERYRPGQVTTFALYIDDQSEGANNKAYVCSNYMPWQTNDVWAPVTTWDALYRGNEMTINITGTSLPGDRAPYISGMADVRGFVHNDITQYPERQANIPLEDLEAGFFTPNFAGIDYSEANPDIVWFIANKKPGDEPLVFRSDDAGDVVNYVSNPSTGTVWKSKLKKDGAGGPKIAVSATDPDNVVTLIKKHVRYTKDGGTTWQTPSNLDSLDRGLERNIEYEFDELIKSDRVNGNKFYLYDLNGKFYRSADGGATFNRVATAGLPARGFIQGGFHSGVGGGVRITVAPGLEEEVWLALGSAGIWRANGTGTNKTDSFEEITFFRRLNPTAVTFGKAAPGSSVPTAYVYASRAADGLWGIWKSKDLGATWELATPIDRPGQWVRVLVGDQQQYGRVFVGDASYGVRVLQTDTTNTEVSDIIIDNTDAEASAQGQWGPRTFAPAGQSFIGANYLVNTSSDPGQVSYSPRIATAGTYNVYGRWIANGQRASNVRYVVNTGSETDTVTVDQRQNGGQWVPLGTYALEAGGGSQVEILNEGTDGITIADAIKWEYVVADPPVRPSGFKATLGNFTRVTLEWFDNASNEENFVLERSTNGDAFSVIDTIEANTLLYTDTTLVFNQQYTYRIKATNAFGESSTTSATVNNTEIVVDNTDADRVQLAGFWAPRNSAFGGTYIGSNFVIDRNELKGEKSVTYTTPIPVEGAYDVYGRWTATSSRAKSVPYIITSARGTDTVIVDQTDTRNRSRWVFLGQYDFTEASGAQVVISNANTSGDVVADAVRLTYEGPSEPQEVLDLNLTSVCSDDPTTERRWRILNPNNFSVTVIWQVYRTNQADTVEAPAGDSFFTTATVGGANTTKIFWKNEEGKTRSRTKASGGAPCSPNSNARQHTVSEKLTEPDVTLFANPATDWLRIKLEGEVQEVQNVRLTDLSGRVFRVKNVSTEGNLISVPVSRLNAGVYLLYGEVGSRSFVKRVLIQK